MSDPLRIVVDTDVVRYQLGGLTSWVLQYLVGFARLGHDVFLVEKSPFPDSCYLPRTDTMTSDPSAGIAWLAPVYERFGLTDRWCYVDDAGTYHGMGRERVAEVLRTADVFIELASYGLWREEAQGAACRVLIDGEPGFNQMRLEQERAAGEPAPPFDRFVTPGLNIGTPLTSAPTGGVEWITTLPPINLDVIVPAEEPPEGAYSTVMNWQAFKPLVYEGVAYHQKAAEFERFMDLPRLTQAPLEVAVGGSDVPVDRLEAAGWRVRPAYGVSTTVESYWAYLRRSRGEFSVAKHVIVATNCGWFSERSAAYLASGRPVVVQDTGFSAHLPTGRGLLAVRDAQEAAQALDEVEADYAAHARWARELACAHFDAREVLGRLLRAVGA